MELEHFRIKHAEPLCAWFDTKDAALQWGGRVFGWPLAVTDIIQRSQEPHVQFRVLTDEAKLLGFLEVQTISEQEVRFCRVAIHPEYRGRKLGQTMILKALAEVKRRPNVRFVSLAVFQLNAGAKHCYEQCGFQVVDREPSYKVFDGVKWPLHQMELRFS